MNDFAESAALGFLRKKVRVGTSTTIQQRNKCQHVGRFFLSIYLTSTWDLGTAKTAENGSLVGSCGLLYTETVVVQ